MAHLKLPVLYSSPAPVPAATKRTKARSSRGESTGPRIHFISLGCARNRVDTEHMLGLVQEGGFQVVEDPQEADAVVVNTCSFIGDAKKESVDTVLAVGQLKTQGKLRSLVVTGCLSQRYSKELSQEMPEVDHFLGTSDYVGLVDVVRADLGLVDTPTQRNLVTRSLDFLARYDLPRVNTLHVGSAYLKISEGCDNACSFCIIPALRGKQRSRTVDDLVREASRLADQGICELTLIAEDLTAYGHDLPGKPGLGDLLSALNDVEGIRWIRCMYAYPRPFKDKLVRAFTDLPHVLPYLDIPVQHASNRVLKLMKRGRDQERLKEMFLDLRARIPRLVLRTTVMVGFPGETDEDFEELLSFIEELRFERLGCFKYSLEEDTAAFDLPDRVSAKVMRSRWDKLMRRQRKISREQQQAMIGTEHEALVEGVSPESDLVMQGRIWSQAPEVDGVTYFSSLEPLHPGQMVKVRITEAHDYDLVGEVVDS